MWEHDGASWRRAQPQTSFLVCWPSRRATAPTNKIEDQAVPSCYFSFFGVNWRLPDHILAVTFPFLFGQDGSLQGTLEREREPGWQASISWSWPTGQLLRAHDQHALAWPTAVIFLLAACFSLLIGQQVKRQLQVLHQQPCNNLTFTGTHIR